MYPGGTPESIHGGAGVTEILDHEHHGVATFAERIKYNLLPGVNQYRALREAHEAIVDRVQLTRGTNESRSASSTYSKKRGSDTHRLALLEAVARRWGIPTRTHLLIAAELNSNNAKNSKIKSVGRQHILLWPEFEIDEWVPAHEVLLKRNVAIPGVVPDLGKALWQYLLHDEARDPKHYRVTDCGYFNSRDDAIDGIGRRAIQHALR